MTSNIGRGGASLLRLLLFVLLFVLTAGCLGADEAVDGTETDTDGTMEPANTTVVPPGPWSLETSVRVEQTAGLGAPFAPRFVTVGLDAVCPHGNVEIEFPAGGSFLSFEVEEPAVNTSEPGAGYATLAYRFEDETWRDAEGDEIEGPIDPRTEPPSEETRVNLTDPGEGTWQVTVWPHGPVVNKAFDLQIEAHGQGPPSGELDDHDRFGAGCAR